MAFDAFVKIQGIEGESEDERHQGWIEIIRYGMGIKQTISTTASSAGGASAERADFKDFTIRKLLDKSSPSLALACADGTHFDNIIIELCRAGTEKMNFMTYTLSNCLICSVATDNGSDIGNRFPVETVKFHFGKIEWCYTRQNRKGGIAVGRSVCGWNLQKNIRM